MISSRFDFPVLLLVVVPAAIAIAPRSAARPRRPRENAQPRPAVIAANEGERRFLRGGTAPLFIKVDPITTGSRRLVVGSSDLPPGDAIGVHRHLREDEIILITRGSARVQLGAEAATSPKAARQLQREIQTELEAIDDILRYTSKERPDDKAGLQDLAAYRKEIQQELTRAVDLRRLHE